MTGQPTSKPTCPSCGAEVPPDAPRGYCLKCLFALGTAEPESLATESPSQLSTLNSQPTPLRSFGDYELLEEIARGGMGIIYKARQKSLGRIVAVKMLLFGGQSGKDQAQRFRAEAAAAASLQHPNIVAIHEVNAHEGQPFFVMDFIEGQNLARLSAECEVRNMEWLRRAARCVKIVAEAIHYAHERGILHRDLKPSNVLIDPFDQPRVTDFGLAKRLHHDSELTLSGQVLGSPNYMPPEQAAAKRGLVGRRSDVYSLGAILYHLLTGRPPFVGETLTDTLQDVVNNEPVSPRLLNPSVPRDLETLCLKCLEKEPARRYQTAQALADDLDRFLKAEPIRARRIGPTAKLWRWGRRKPALAGLGAATLVLLLVVAVGSPIAAWRISQAREGEQVQLKRAESTLARLEIERADQLLASGDAPRGLAYLARLLRQHPDNRVVAERLMSALSLANFSLPTLALQHDPPLQQFSPNLTNAGTSLGQLIHGGSVTAGNFSPDGQRVLTASEDGTARVWDSRTGQLVCPPLRHQAAVVHAQFSPDGQQVLTASLDRTARLWNAETGQPVLPAFANKGSVVFAEFSRDGSKVVTASEDKMVRIWNAVTGHLVCPPMTNEGSVGFATFSGDGSRVLAVIHTAPDTGVARVWDASSGVERAVVSTLFNIPNLPPYEQLSEDGKRIFSMRAETGFGCQVWDISGQPVPVMRLPHQAKVNSICLSARGDLVATASHDNTARVWDARTGEPISRPLEHDHWVTGVHFSADGQRLVTASRDRTARVWNVHTGALLTEPLRHESPLALARLSPDGQRVLTVSEENTAWIWDVRGGQPVTMRFPHGGQVSHARFSRDGGRIVTASLDGTARVWGARTGKPVSVFQAQGKQTFCAEFSPDGQRIAASGDDGVQVWDLVTGQHVGERFDSSSLLSRVHFSSDGRRIAVVSRSPLVPILDVLTGRRLVEFEHPPLVFGVAFSPDDRSLATASLDYTARIWDSRTGQPITDPLQHDDYVFWVEFSPDGQRIVTASRDRTARVWDAQTGRLLATLVHADSLYSYHSVQFSPDGWRVATAAGTAAQVWDARTSQPITPPIMHHGQVYSVRFSPDGQRIVTACYDGTARVWEAASGLPLSEPLRHTAPVLYTEFSPDGTRILTASRDQTARVWDLPQASIPVPAWLPELAEAVAGQRMDARDMSSAVPVAELFKLRQRLSELSGPGHYERWAQWFLASNLTRTLSPGSPVTVPEIVQRLIEENTLESLRQAVWLAPTNALALARLASTVAAPRSQETSKATAESEALSRRAVDLSPNDPEVLRVRSEVRGRIDNSQKP